MHTESIVNIIAMICSLIAMIQFAIAAPKIGGTVGKILKLLVVGIFFSVFTHAAVELACAYNFIAENDIMPIMGALITFGSLFFIAAGSIAIKTFKR
ncbi:MAG TPA: hypothetical protein DCL35_07035 [Candidatus Omnitrophica bacterium]|nr:hypothetical protein [Candidatus Omnitrophota bacterium]